MRRLSEKSMQVLLPSEELTALAKKLKAIEDYARQYYLTKDAKDEPEPEPTPEPEPSPEPDVTPVQPE